VLLSASLSLFATDKRLESTRERDLCRHKQSLAQYHLCVGDHETPTNKLNGKIDTEGKEIYHGG
jgi:hypothetical protein